MFLHPGWTNRVRRLLEWLLRVAVLVAGAAASAQVPVSPTLQLTAATKALDVPTMLAWTGPESASSLQQAQRGDLPFRIVQHGAVHRLGFGQVLWLKLNVRRDVAGPDQWILEFPMPILDAVTVFQQDAAGVWRGRSAGDTVPMGTWPEAGRYPFFRLLLPDGEPREIYVQVRHSTPLSLPMRMATRVEHDHRMQLEYLGLGVAFGALALLVAFSVARAVKLRDSAYGWFSLYSLLAMIAVGAFTGSAFHLLWGESGAWADAAPGCLALVAGGIALNIVRVITGIGSRVRWLGRALAGSAWLGALLGVAYLNVDRRVGIVMLGAFLLVVAILSMTAAILTWRRGDPVGRWMTLGALPLAASVLYALARVFGWIEATWFSEYSVVIALVLDLPMLLGALNSRSTERRGAQLRQLASDSIDPLTGMLRAKPFHARVVQALLRYHRRGESAAVAVIEVANHAYIKASRGNEAAEESMLRAVIKLRRLIRDVDTTGRIGEARFGLILEGVASRNIVRQFASRLVASGLMLEEGSEDAELQLHIVAVLLNEHAPNEPDLMRSLTGVLERMHARTHKPFRFVDPGDSKPGEPSTDGLSSQAAPLAAEPG